MKMNTFKRDSRRGSALLAAMIVIVILTFAAAGILSYSLNTYRNSVRQAMLDQGKAIADSEMDFVYYTWKGYLLQKKPVANIQGLMSGVLGTNLTAQAATFEASSNPWTVSRYLKYAPISGTTDGGATGILPGTTSIGRNYYFTAMTSATINMPLLGDVTYNSGRNFVFSNTSLFQYAVFYQGNLEMAAGGDMTISGPISTNASAFLGAGDNGGTGNPFSLTLTDSVAFFQDYNGAADPTSGETDYLLQGSSNLVDPIYNPNPDASAPTNQVAQRALQVSKLTAQSSFIGGVDVQADVNNPSYAAAYTNLQGVVDPNEVYRAVIAPPPTTDGEPTSADLTEDETVAGSRMYNRAGILITIEQTSPGPPVIGVNVAIHVGIAPDATIPRNTANLHLYDAIFPSITNPTGAATDVIQGVRQTFVDPREVQNGASGVNLTTIDVGNLNVALNSGIMSAGTTLQQNYNGVVYIYDNTNNATNPPANGTTTLTSSLNGIRIVDGTSTPNFSDQNGNPIGFTMVSNNGLYVQGDYNTSQITIGGVPNNDNPSAVMGDAITALSQGWNLTANQGTTLQAMTPGTAGGAREATASTAFPYTTAQSAMSTAYPTLEPPTAAGTANGMQINAAILTGNTPTNVSGSLGSGGAQNLVRMIEDWYYDPTGSGAALTLTLKGSLGQLFTSKYFSGAYLGSGVTHGIYIQPKSRVLSYDPVFKNNTPAGSPSTTSFTRGSFFFAPPPAQWN
jgi:hypothetical protein